MSPEQKEVDIKYLSHALSVGPARYEQLADGIYDIYRRWGFNPMTDVPISVLDQLRGSYSVPVDAGQCGDEPF